MNITRWGFSIHNNQNKLTLVQEKKLINNHRIQNVLINNLVKHRNLSFKLIWGIWELRSQHLHFMPHADGTEKCNYYCWSQPPMDSPPSNLGAPPSYPRCFWIEISKLLVFVELRREVRRIPRSGLNLNIALARQPSL